MKIKLLKIAIIIFSVLFAIRVTTIFTADRLYSMSLAAETGKITPGRAILLLNIASKLDSSNANIYYQKSEMRSLEYNEKRDSFSPIALRHNIKKFQLQALAKCIDLCPSNALYHAAYAVTLKQMTPKPNITTKSIILSETKKSTELIPVSDEYKSIYEYYLDRYQR